MRAFTALYKPYNDIDIYVEDRTLIGLYERLFTRILAGLAKITTVTPLGSRDAVLAEARRLRTDATRRRFFLIDGDFFWVLGPIPRIKGVYTLRCYSIENLAFERDPVLRAAYVLAPDRPCESIQVAFSEDKFNAITKVLFPLFEAYAMGWVLKTSCETVSHSVFRLLETDSHILNRASVRARIREVYSHFRGHSNWSDIVAAKRRVRDALKKVEADEMRFISGKSHLFGVLLRWFQGEVNFRGNQRQLVSMILEHSSLSIDPGMTRALRRIVNSK